jgi:hypothetical protein
MPAQPPAPPADAEPPSKLDLRQWLEPAFHLASPFDPRKLAQRVQTIRSNRSGSDPEPLQQLTTVESRPIRVPWSRRRASLKSLETGACPNQGLFYPMTG